MILSDRKKMSFLESLIYNYLNNERHLKTAFIQNHIQTTIPLLWSPGRHGDQAENTLQAS